MKYGNLDADRASDGIQVLEEAHLEKISAPNDPADMVNLSNLEDI